MKAVEKLHDVEKKLKRTAREFEQARRDAKEAKEEFQIVKSKR
jgi:structural maintenance of chromosome 1